MRPQNNIFVGLWANKITSNVFNSPLLTVPDIWGIVIFSTLAILIAHISKKCWTIVKFLTFCLFRPFRGGRLDEYAVMLRNNPTAFSTAFAFISIARRDIWSRNRRDRERLGRRHRVFICSVIISGIIHSACFVSLGAFLPFALIEILSKLNNVNCGYWPVNISDLESIGKEDVRRFILSQYAKFVASGTAVTTGYVSECYDAAQLSSCDLMINRQIPWTETNNATCPFASGQCVGGDSSAYTMTTTNITAAYYGINIKSTLTISRESTCAPIIMDPYRCDDEHGGHGYCHFTYYGKNHSIPVRMDEANAYQVHGWFPQPNFTVHPNFQAKVGNVSLVYLSRRELVHLYETHDPFFRATEKIPLPGFEEGGYVPAWKDRVTAIGCVEKLQLCASFNGIVECSPWVGVVRGESNTTGLEPFVEKCTLEDRGLISLLLPRTPVLQTIGDAARGSGSELIASQQLLFVPRLQAEVQTASGNDQWKIEVGQWFNIILAISQLAVVHFPIGNPFIDTTQSPNEMLPESRFICENVLIRSFKHTTIRLPGLIFLVVGSAFAILVCGIGKHASAFLQRQGYWRDVLESWDRLSWESKAAVDALGAAGQAHARPEEGIPLAG